MRLRARLSCSSMRPLPCYRRHQADQHGRYLQPAALLGAATAEVVNRLSPWVSTSSPIWSKILGPPTSVRFIVKGQPIWD